MRRSAARAIESKSMADLNTEAGPALAGSEQMASSGQTLTVPDMARLLGLTETTVRTYATARQYLHLIPRPFKRPGGRRLLWDAREVRAWLVAGKPPSVEKPRKPRGRPTKAEQLARARAQASTLSGLGR